MVLSILYCHNINKYFDNLTTITYDPLNKPLSPRVDYAHVKKKEIFITEF